MRMLVLSENLPTTTRYSNVEIHKWASNDRPLITNYEIIVLDMKASSSRFTSPKIIHGIRDEIIRLLNVGGVVICLMHATMEIDGKMDGVSFLLDPPRLDKTRSRRMTNYDWLPFELLESTKLYLKSKIGTKYRLIKKSKEFERYFIGVKHFPKIIESVVLSKDRKKWRLYYPELDKSIKNFHVRTCDMDVVATNPVTEDPIAGVIYYQNGSLIFLPQSKLTAHEVIFSLFEIGKKYYEFNIEKLERSPEIPEWIDNYKTEQEKTIDYKISELKEKLQNEKSKRSRFRKVDALLYSTGKPLEKAVMLVFKEFNLDVEKADPSANKDLIVEDSSGNRLLVEVTGIADKVKQNSKEMGQLLQLIGERKGNEKIVLIANTYRGLEPKNREGKDHFTKEVKKIAKINEICLMTTVDLFNWWKDFLEEQKTPEQVIDSILNTNGEYKLQ